MQTLTFRVAAKCPDCEAEMESVDIIEREHSFRIGPWEFRLWKWSKGLWCLECSTAGDNRAAEEAFEAGYNKAAKEIRDAAREDRQ